MPIAPHRPQIVLAAALAQAPLSEPLLAGALSVLAMADVDVRVVEVAGCFELPVLCQRAFREGAEAVVAVGAIVDDGTPHGHYLAASITTLLGQIAVDAGRPLGFGIVTVANLEQGLNRVGLPTSTWDKGGDAVRAVLKSLDALTVSESARNEGTR